MLLLREEVVSYIDAPVSRYFFIIIDYRILLVGLLECNFLMTPFVHQLVGRSVGRFVGLFVGRMVGWLVVLS